MSDQKITGLTADASPTTDDLVVTVNDPGGTPANRKVTVANLMNAALMQIPYKFSASSNTQRTSGNGAFAVFLFEDEDYDTGSNYDNTTGVFTVPVSGFYHFDAYTHWDSSANDIIISIYKNGSEFRRGNRDKSATAIIGLGVSADMQLTAADTVDIRIFGSNNTSDESTAANFFNGRLVSIT